MGVSSTVPVARSMQAPSAQNAALSAANPLSSAPPRTSSFGALIAASRDGTFHAGSSVGVSWTAPGHAYLFAAGSLHLAGNRNRGTFSGLFYDRGATALASGSFSCM